ncbi:MAG: PQQ-binding-like beta-propeller repeat protein [Planctomycetota bacterium]
MPAYRPPSSQGSDADFDLARRAVDAGLLSEEQVEAALIAQEKEPSRGLLEFLPLPAESLRALRPVSTRTIPAEVAEAMQDPSKRFGDYWLVSKLDEGGMGEVFRAWDGRLGRWVAVKMPKKPESGVARMYFEREAGMIAGLDHPNIAKVFEVGEIAGKPFLAMQLIEGKTLDDAGPGVAREQRLRWVRDAASAVGAAHAAGVIHRDIKPSNVMVGPDGHVYVLDFGLAKSVEIADGTGGASHLIAGTPNYMSPEQARGKAETRSDIYGLGGVLYALMTGRAPFVGENATEVILQVVDRDPLAPRKLDPGMSSDLEAIVLKCLEKDPARRYATIAELLEDIDACLAGAPLRHARRRTALYVLGRQVRRQPLPWSLGALAAVLAVAFAAAGGWWYAKPGTLRLRISPSGATVSIEGRTWNVGTDSLEVVLSQGAHAVRVEAPGYEPAMTVVLVTREGEVLPVTLRHQRGILEFSVDPSSGRLEVDGSPLGAPELDSGKHSLLAFAPGCFDAVRTVDIPAGGAVRADFGLESGELWRLRSDAIQAGCNARALPDIDGDGAADVAVEELREVALVSGSTGSLIRRVRVADSPSWNMDRLDLGGAEGQVLAAYSCSTRGLRLDLFDLTTGGGGKRRLEWSEPGNPGALSRGAALKRAPDMDGDGVAELVLGVRDGTFWLVNSVKGTATALRTGFDQLWSTTCLVEEDRLVFSGPDHPGQDLSGRQSFGALSLSDGSLLWSQSGDWIAILTEDLEGRGHASVYGVAADHVDVFDGLDGRRLRTLKTPFPGRPRFVDTSGTDPRRVFLFAGSDELAALDPKDGHVLWRVRTNAPVSAAPGPRGEIFVMTEDALLSLDRDTGRTLWKVDGKPEGSLVVDLDRDGREEVVVGISGQGFQCVTDAGVPLWRLRLKGSPRPLGTLDSGEERRILFGRGSSFVGLARTPRELWHADAPGPLLAAPVVARSRLGPVVFQAGDWGQLRWLRQFDGRTGTTAWTFEGSCPPNNPPLATDWDGDGDAEVLAWVQTAGLNALEVFRAGGGLSRKGFSGPGETDVYATPAVADFDGDGALDAALTRRQSGDAIAWSGRDGHILWRVDLKGASWGGPAVVDLDGDAHPDMLAAADGQPLRALRGTDGTFLWEAPVGGGVRHVPVLAMLNGDASPDILVMTIDGDLVALDGQSGTRLASVSCSDPGTDGPSVAPKPGGGHFILVPCGRRGVSSFAWPGLERQWTAPLAAIGTPLAADLDGDGKWEVAATSSAGSIEVLDLATGKVLWSHALSPEGCVAGPALADLDGDGILDILAADRGGRLTAVSGRPTRAARR